MASNCVDVTDQTINYSASGPYVDSAGEFTISQVNKFAEEYAASILRDIETNPIKKAINLYGDSIYEARDFLNGNFFRAPYVQDVLSDYPDLERRWNKGNITNIEFSDFLNDYNLTPQSLINKGNNNYTGLLSDLDGYYKASFSDSILGGFCKLVPQVFGAIDAFFDTLVAVEDAITQILAKLRNLDEALNALAEKITIEFLINEIKKLITELIDKVFAEVMSIVENFNIEEIIGDISTFIREDIVKQIVAQKERACLLLNEDKKKEVKEETESLIDYVAGLFQNPQLEEIEFLVMRFCAYATQIEALIRDVNQPLADYTNRYRRITDRLKVISNLNTSTAVRNGGIRLSDERKKEVINSMEQQWDENEETINPPPPSVKEYFSLPSCKAVKEGTDPKIGISGDWTDPEVLGLEGWVNIDLDVKVYLVRLQEALGQGKLNVIAGWRNEAYNEEIGASPESPHLTGLAVDVEILGDADEMCKIALEKGFRYCKVNSTFIHLDLKPRPQG